jgi:hypothetical protein
MSFLAPEWQEAHDLYDVALKFVLSDSRVHAPIFGPPLVEPAQRTIQSVANRTATLAFQAPPDRFAAQGLLVYEAVHSTSSYEKVRTERARCRDYIWPLDRARCCDYIWPLDRARCRDPFSLHDVVIIDSYAHVMTRRHNVGRLHRRM